jgi:hypothetical protein
VKQSAKRILAIVQPRKYNRYRIQVPVIFSWKGAQGIRQQGAGLTHDLSVRGAFIFATSPPPLNANVKFKVYLRSAARPLRIYARGQVVRVEPAHERHRAGFAVAAEPFVLRRGEAQESLASSFKRRALRNRVRRLPSQEERNAIAWCDISRSTRDTSQPSGRGEATRKPALPGLR